MSQNKFSEFGDYVEKKSKQYDFPKYIRIINLGIGGLLIFIGIWKIITLQIFTNILTLKFFNVFVPFFFILFGGILLLSELKPELIIEYLKILKTYIGLGSFYLFLSSLTVYNVEQETNAILGWIYGIILFTVGVYYIILHFISKQKEQNESASSSFSAPLV
ncbi:COPI associated protein (macronuclear) [Tetrahymena thermophila SB210]|uniref:COPI associated protein n=1 Tax=Tetrahymena thermophila (strain SB210) TaxID=312017 RepID=I7MHA5_TETTS|nr:COPI associated protein [Tetrahymena thermophila SB210]EAR87381.2 COPI associated protein [Tetrahymena thermophila SB210]|eukprot:XP_001007626.2 COPI associated protein [Tetrahymena thermophila SB210]